MFSKLIYKRIITSFIFLFFQFLFLNLFITVCTSDDVNVIVGIDPSVQNVLTLESFTVNINCTPSIPIKAFEFGLDYNSSLLQANSVVEGNIFSGYQTFFNSGVINNTQGSIRNVYGLIIGQGNVTTPGILATVSFTATSNIGISNLTLVSTGITNETEYLTILTNNGNIIINNPYYFHILSNETPINNSVGVSIQTSSLSIDIEDPEGDLFYWEITTSPYIGNDSKNNDGNGTKTCNISNLNYQTTYYWFVKCMDLNSGQWTNNTYMFKTASGSTNPPGGGGGFPPSEPVENNPPNKPLIPIGLIFIEKGILYQYSSSTFDIDNDGIRYMFDWGDGSFSNWSEYLSSNTTIYMTHSWDYISNFEIRVLAQDEDGLNSSWSEPLEIIVSETNDSGEEPIIIINVTNDFNVSNKSFIFDASQCIIFDGVIINYTWDFGDGVFGYGLKATHTYKLSKEYIVTLYVIDNHGNTYSESITLNVFDESDNNVLKEESVFLDIKSIIVILVFILIFIILIVKFREKIEMKIINHKIYSIEKSRIRKK